MSAVLIYLASFGTALALLGGVGPAELTAAAILAAVTLGWSIAVRAVARRPIGFSWAHLGAWGRAIARLPADTARAGGVLAQVAITGGSPGRASERPFRGGAVDDATARARRATAILATSLGPDMIVVDAAPGEGEALCHRLSRTQPSENREWLA